MQSPKAFPDEKKLREFKYNKCYNWGPATSIGYKGDTGGWKPRTTKEAPCAASIESARVWGGLP